MSGKVINIRLYLENGLSFGGSAFGYFRGEELTGELTVNTGLTGYQEIITDPASAGKILCMTTPLIGSYGLNLDDMQAEKPHLKALVVRHKSDYPSNWRCEMSLDGYLKQNRILGIEEIDPRALTRIARDAGPLKVLISANQNLTESQVQQKLSSIPKENLVEKVTTKQKHVIDGKKDGKELHIAVLDLGLKASVRASLQKRGARLTVFPAFTSSEDILGTQPDGIFLTSGPGSPDDIEGVVSTVAGLVEKKPVVGIGLGHLVLAKALGCGVTRMKFGHFGGNYPVKSVACGSAYITSQGHDYVVSVCPADVLPSYININDQSIEGIRHKTLHAASVAWAPEGNPGPNTDFVFDDFLKIIEEGRAHHA